MLEAYRYHMRCYHKENKQSFNLHAPIREYRSSLNDGQRGATSTERSKMDEVPIRQMAIIRRVLAHGTDDKAVDQCDAADGQWVEQRRDLIRVGGVQLERRASRWCLRRRIERDTRGWLTGRWFVFDASHCDCIVPRLCVLLGFGIV